MVKSTLEFIMLMAMHLSAWDKQALCGGAEVWGCV